MLPLRRWRGGTGWPTTAAGTPVAAPPRRTGRSAPADATRITCPVLYIGGSDSGPWFARVREQVLEWFPRAGSVVVEGAGHDLPLTHHEQVAAAIASFLGDIGPAS